MDILAQPLIEWLVIIVSYNFAKCNIGNMTPHKSSNQTAMNISIILDLVLTVQLTKPAIECVKQFFSQKNQQQLFPVLLAFDENNPVFQVEELNSSFLTINERYDVHFEFTSLHVNSAVVFLGCATKNSRILWTIKKNRLISVKMKLLLVVDVRCRSFPASEAYLDEIARILGPACSAVIAYNGVEENFHWAWSHGLKRQTSHSGSIDPKQCQIEIPDVKEFKGHDFKASSSPQEPYVLNPNPAGELEEGLEIEIIRNIVDTIGMKLTWVPIPANEPARLLQNAKNEYIGMFGLLHRLEADITFGGIAYQNGRFHAAELIISHTEDTLSWFIPSAPEANNLGAIFSVFSLTMWFLVGLSVFLFTVVFSLENYLKTFPSNLTQTIGILLDQSVHLESHSYLHFWLLYVLYCLVLTNAYRSSLITALTSKKQGSWFETPEEAVDAGETTFMVLAGMPLFQETAAYDPMWRTILQPGRHEGIEGFSFLKNVSETRHGLVLCIHYPCQFSIYQNNLLGSDLKPKVIYLKKRFTRFPATMFMAPGSVLQPAVELCTLWLIEGGLINQWLAEMEGRARLTALFADHGGSGENGPQKLSFLHLQATFFIYLSFLLLSLIVFWLEFLCFKMDNLLERRRTKILQIRQMFFVEN